MSQTLPDERLIKSVTRVCSLMKHSNAKLCNGEQFSPRLEI